MGESQTGSRTCLGYVENGALAITLAVADDRAAGRVYNVADTESPSMSAWTRMIGQAAGWSGSVTVVPDDKLPQHLAHEGRTEQHLILDTARIRRELGFSEPVPVEEALRRP